MTINIQCNNRLNLTHVNKAPVDLDRYVCLSQGETRHIKTDAQTIHIVSGQAWVSYEGEDHILKSGDLLAISKGDYAAVISPLGNHDLVYELFYAE